MLTLPSLSTPQADLQNEQLQRKREEEYSSHVKSLLSHNKQLLQEQASRVANIPEALRVDSSKLVEARDVQSTAKEAMERAVAQRVSAIEFGQKAAMKNMQQQFEYWKKKKGTETRKFVDDFNAYHKAKSGEIDQYKTELLLLYSHCDKLARIVQKMEKGSYPFGIRSGIKSVKVARTSTDPMDIFKQPGRAQYIRRQLNISSNLLHGLDVTAGGRGSGAGASGRGRPESGGLLRGVSRMKKSRPSTAYASTGGRVEGRSRPSTAGRSRSSSSDMNTFRQKSRRPQSATATLRGRGKKSIASSRRGVVPESSNGDDVDDVDDVEIESMDLGGEEEDEGLDMDEDDEGQRKGPRRQYDLGLDIDVANDLETKLAMEAEARPASSKLTRGRRKVRVCFVSRASRMDGLRLGNEG